MTIQKFAALTLFCLSPLFCSYVRADIVHPAPSKKIYVDIQAVKITKEGIFLSTTKGLTKVKTLRSDEKGIFVLERELSSIEKGHSHNNNMASCPYCYHYFSENEIWKHVRNCPCRPY